MVAIPQAQVEPNYNHPSKFSDAILHEIKELLFKHGMPPAAKLLDPFAGTGRVHHLRRFFGGLETAGIELEPEWVACSLHTQEGDALNLPFDANSFDVVVTSPPYGNRMSDNDMRPSVAGTYMKSLGRRSVAGSGNHLQWGHRYREFMHRAWEEVDRVLKPGGLFVLNISDHVRDKQVQNVSAWHNAVLTGPEIGMTWIDAVAVETPRMRRGANHEARVESEWVLVYRRRELLETT